jgi:hypothetical protein
MGAKARSMTKTHWPIDSLFRETEFIFCRNPHSKYFFFVTNKLNQLPQNVRSNLFLTSKSSKLIDQSVFEAPEFLGPDATQNALRIWTETLYEKRRTLCKADVMAMLELHFILKNANIPWRNDPVGHPEFAWKDALKDLKRSSFIRLPIDFCYLVQLTCLAMQSKQLDQRLPILITWAENIDEPLPLGWWVLKENSIIDDVPWEETNKKMIAQLFRFKHEQLRRRRLEVDKLNPKEENEEKFFQQICEKLKLDFEG